MKYWIVRGIVSAMVVCLACSLPALSGCGGGAVEERGSVEET